MSESDANKTGGAVDEAIAAAESKTAEARGEAIKEREKRKGLEKQLLKFDGVDLEEWKRFRTEKQESEDEKARAAGDFEKLMQQERDKFAKELEKRDTGMAGMKTSLEAALIDAAATKAISKFEGDAELLLPHVKANTKLVEVNGKHVAVVLDDSGEPRLAPDAKTATDYMGIEHLVSGWKEAGKFAGAFAGTGASGGGATASTRIGGAGTQKRISRDEAVRMDPSELKKGLQSGAFQVTD